MGNLWKPGESGNPAGRPKGTKNKFSIVDLQKAMDKAKEKNGGVSLLEHVCRKAYNDNGLAIAILKKMLPDLRRVEAIVDVDLVGFATMTPAEAAASMDKATLGEKPDDSGVVLQGGNVDENK